MTWLIILSHSRHWTTSLRLWTLKMKLDTKQNLLYLCWTQQCANVSPQPFLTSRLNHGAQWHPQTLIDVWWKWSLRSFYHLSCTWKNYNGSFSTSDLQLETIMLLKTQISTSSSFFIILLLSVKHLHLHRRTGHRKVGRLESLSCHWTCHYQSSFVTVDSYSWKLNMWHDRD